MVADDFVHLHVHTDYSLLDGACRIDTLVQEAKRQGMQALAISDHGVMYGAIPFYRACREHGIKPIIGVEVYVTNDPLDKKGRPGELKLYHLLLLATNITGYRNLIQLTTKAHLEGFYYKPRVTKQWLAAHQDGIICLSGCLAAELPQALLADDEGRARQVIDEHLRIYGQDHYYIELQDHGIPEQKKINPRLIRLANEYGIPLVATNDVHYLHQQDAQAHDCLLCIGTGSKVSDNNRLKFPGAHFYFCSKEEMAQRFRHVPEALQNSVQIAERCQLDIGFGQEIVPSFPVPDGESSLSYLHKQCQSGLTYRYDEVTNTIRDRLAYELEIIGQMGYADYFLIVWDFIRFAREKHIMVGPGRGSAAGSLVAYVLGITNIDPIRYKLLFERFLNPERVNMPDIDIDFSDVRRDEVIRYVVHKYGAEHVAQIVTFGTMGAKAAIRDVGRVLDIPLATVNTISKQIPSAGMTIRDALGQSEQLQEMAEQDSRIRQLFQISAQLEGKVRHTSTHAAGVVISEAPLTNYVPLQEGHDDIPLTQYAMEDLEAIGLLKMDFLGLSNLSLLEEIIRLIHVNGAQNTSFSLDSIPFDDRATFELLSSGDTAGIFQLESDGMRQVLRRLQPSSFEDIIAVLALYRPGPMDNIPLFIDAKHGRTTVTYPHEDLKPILEETYGIIVYQEQIMQIASKMAGFSLGEADLLRRAVGKKKRDILEEEREHFVQGCQNQGYSQDTAEHVYDLIVRFADYGFNRSHSAAYAVIAYQLAYLKCHYPQAFMAALMSRAVADEQKIAHYTTQAQKFGSRIYPPSILHSGAHFTLERDGIRFGLSVIKHVGKAAIEQIVQEREKRPFRNLLDFCQRVNLRICNRKVIESLIKAGALDHFHMHRAQMLANLDAMLDMAEKAQNERQSDQLFFFADELPDDYTWADAEPLSKQEQLNFEKEALGFYLSGHPLDEYRPLAKSYGLIPLEAVMHQADKETVRTMGCITRVRRIRTKKGQAMAFCSLEDRDTEVDVVVFPNVYAQHTTLYREQMLIIIEGAVEKRDDRQQLIARRVAHVTALDNMKPKDEKAQQSPKQELALFIKITAQQETKGILTELKRLLRQHQGNVPVYIHYANRKQTILLDDMYKTSGNDALLVALRNLLADENAVRLQAKV